MIVDAQRRRRVVITGLGVVAPNGIGKDAFWQSLIAGESAVDWITSFDTTPYPCKVAAQVRNFKPTDFISLRRARNMGRFTHLAVAASRLALEDSNLRITTTLSPKITVCFGTSGGGDVFQTAIEDFRLTGVRGLNPWSALEYPPHAPTAYVSIEFAITGPALSVSSNCCTGLDAVSTAVARIRSGEATVAIAGSSDAPVLPTPFATFCALGAVSRRNDEPRKASRPYDLLRDGLVVGEGGCAFVLEEFEFARDRGAKIYAEVKGYAACSEAIDMRKGDLSGAVMAGAIEAAIKKSSLLPSEIDHVNAHGSSLPDFDVCDSNAFKQAFRDHAHRIPITSIKSMIGQPFAAAGSLQAAAACLSIQHQAVPPTINQEVPDPKCDLDYVPNKSRVARLRNVLINAHSFGGGCSALVIGRIDE